MKKILTIFISIISVALIAQVPQGVGYQAVATDANGIELVNQSISIRASVLSGSANGTVEWEETHATSTDTFGLFALTIGEGTSTGNGAQLSFADISWGTNTHYLKIEIDVTGGSNYSFMGTNQMMSVPYALYAESANIDYDSISNLLSNDTTFITNVGGGIGGGGCNFKFPEGLHGEGVNIDLSNITYTVPAGKRLYVTNYYDSGTGIWIDGVSVHYNGDIASPIIVNEGQTISTAYNVLLVSGYLVSPSIDLDAINMDLSNITYTVPAGKRLYVTNYYDSGTGIWIDGVVAHSNGDIASPIIVNEGQTISTAYNVLLVSGYIVDENYFADCGGGSSANNSNNISISQYGDTLYINGQAIVIPGVSQSNLNYQFYNYGSVADVDGNTYKTLIYGDKEWMIENLKTAIGNYATVSQHNGAFQSYADSVGYYYSASDALANVCPTGWHVATMQDWQDLHYEIYGTNMNPNGYTNSASGYDDNNYTILWSQHQGGTNQSAFNLIRTGYWSNSGNFITGDPSAAHFWSPDGCNNSNLYRVNLYDGNDVSNPWSLDVGCTSSSNVKAQIRCVKD